MQPVAARTIAILALLALPAALSQRVFADPAILADTDLTGEDYRHFDLPRPRPRLCQEACAIDAQCRAWTFLREGALGPLAVCWLKSGSPTPHHDICCSSGLK
jgi:hypothetical protein